MDLSPPLKATQSLHHACKVPESYTMSATMEVIDWYSCDDLVEPWGRFDYHLGTAAAQVAPSIDRMSPEGFGDRINGLVITYL